MGNMYVYFNYCACSGIHTCMYVYQYIAISSLLHLDILSHGDISQHIPNKFDWQLQYLQILPNIVIFLWHKIYHGNILSIV